MSFVNQYSSNISFSREFVENGSSYIYFLSFGTKNQVYITKTDISGNVIWSKEILNSTLSESETDLQMVQVKTTLSAGNANISGSIGLSIEQPLVGIEIGTGTATMRFQGRYIIIAKSSNNPTLNLLAVDSDGNISWNRAYDQAQKGNRTQKIIAGNSDFYVLASQYDTEYYSISRFDANGNLLQIVNLNNIIKANDIALWDQSLFVAGNYTGQAAIVELNAGDFSVKNAYQLSSKEPLGNIWQIAGNDDGKLVLKLETNTGIFGIGLFDAANSGSAFQFVKIGDDFPALCISDEYIYFTINSIIYKTNLSLDTIWKKQMISENGILMFNELSYLSFSEYLTASSGVQDITNRLSGGIIFYMNQEADTCLTIESPANVFLKYSFSLVVYRANSPEILKAAEIKIQYAISDVQIVLEKLCGTSEVDESGLLQSSCLYLQAAGSTGIDSSAGIHLRWILKGVLGEHLPKGNYYTGSPAGFNRADDFVQILRAPYNPVITQLNLFVAPNTVTDNTGTWLYQVNSRNFYIYFRNITKYKQIRNSIDPSSNPSEFIRQYADNIIEIEIKEDLFFAAKLYFSGMITESAFSKTEILSVETNQIDIPKHTTFRKTLQDEDLAQKIFAENGRSIRFMASEIYVNAIDFEFYGDFISKANQAGIWKDLGRYSLSLEDGEVVQRLDPDPVNHPVHAVWQRYNDGEFTNIENYKTKWNGDLSDTRNRIKHSVQQYIDLSNDPLNPLANEIYYLEDENGNILDSENGMEISHLVLLQMASFDYHIARMLGLGQLDFSQEIYGGGQYVYAAQYSTEADLGDGNGARKIKHLSLSLPTSLNDERPTLPVELLAPVPGIISSETEVGNTQVITDQDGYTHDGTARYLSLFTKELTPDEPENSSFYFSSQNFDMSEFTYPVFVGIEYKKEGDSSWKIPELPNDPEYQNVNSQGNISGNETVSIAIPDIGQPAYVHRETRSGVYIYGSYGINWFSRAKSSGQIWNITSEIKATNRLLPPSNINAVLIREESPLLFTSENEQTALGNLTTEDKTFIRLTFEYDTAQELISYQKKINGILIPDFSPLPDTEEIFADETDIFFRPEIPKQVFGMIADVSDLLGNPLVSVIQSADFILYSTGNPDVPNSSQILSPFIPSEEIQNYIGGIFTVGSEHFIIQNILPGSDPDLPVFHILKQQVSDAFGQNGNIPFDPADFITPSSGQSFMAVENMQNETTWGNVNPNPLKVKIGAPDWSIHTEEIESEAGQETDVEINTYFRKFRGINRNAEIKKYIDPAIGDFQGVYEITFSGYTLNNHPQYSSVIGQPSVQWYRGSVRIAREEKPNEERKILKVLRIDNDTIANGNLVIYAVDETFEDDPLQSGDQRTALVNFYPGYRVYLYKNEACRLNEENIYSQDDDILEKYTVFGLRTVDNDQNYASPISTPTLMFSRRVENPQTPQKPIGAQYATRPDYFGRSTYAFTTEYNHKPFSVHFLRSNDDILLSSLYKQTKYGEDTETDSVQDIRIKNDDEFVNDRLLDLANASIDPSTHLFKEYNGYRMPIPNNPALFENINLFIQDHNQFYGESLPQIAPQDVTDMQFVIIQGHTSNKHGAYDTLTFYDFVKQTVLNTYVPLTEIPIIYQYIKGGNYRPIPKAQVIRDRNATLLSPLSPDFDMAPMAKILETNPHKTLFVDFTLDGNSKSVYFYAVKEANPDMQQSSFSPAVGPVRLVNSFPVKTPEIRSVIPVLENQILGISPKMEVKINSYQSIHHIKKVKLYRALNMADAMSVRSMTLINEMNLESEEMLNDELWTVSDDFSDLSEIPFSDPLYYRVTVEAEIQYAEAQYDGQSAVIVTDYAPSEASKLMITTITENVLPDSPELSYTAIPLSGYILSDVIFSWNKQAYKAKYHLYKMNNQGNWSKIALVESNENMVSLNLSDTDWGSGNLSVQDSEENTVYHHFKIITENTAGMMSVQENILTVGKELF